ncbi:MAG: hypothetical protein HY271_20760 [Deltaproteobacteria bacterium]|nr:hypothetical protein [Deltaproteobacteria bacterium]
MVLAGAGLVVAAPQACADVLIRLQSGVTLRASSYWVEGDVVKFEHRGGIVGFARDAVVAIEDAAPLPKDAASEMPASRTAAAAAAPDARVRTRDPAGTSGASASATASAAEKVNDDSHPAAKLAASADPDLAPVPEEDLQARMARLDKLSLTTHRELTIARNQGQADEVLDRLQRRIDEINRQRSETIQRLGALR